MEYRFLYSGFHTRMATEYTSVQLYTKRTGCILSVKKNEEGIQNLPKNRYHSGGQVFAE